MNLSERLTALVAEWRDQTKHDKLDDPIYEVCAEELETELAAESSLPPQASREAEAPLAERLKRLRKHLAENSLATDSVEAARVHFVERLDSILRNYAPTEPTQRGVASAAVLELVANALGYWLYDYEHGIGNASIEVESAMEYIEPALFAASVEQAATAPPIALCNAPNPDGSYLCNQKPHETGDHVHSFINADGERDFFWWAAAAVKGREAT